MINGLIDGKTLPRYVYFQTIGGEIYGCYGGEPDCMAACISEKEAKRQFGKSYIKTEIFWRDSK